MKKKILSLTMVFVMLLGLMLPVKSLARERDLNVTRIAGSGRYETAVEVSKETFEESKYAIVASGENFPDALVGGTLASQIDAPILLTTKNSISTKVLNELERLEVEKVYLLGGTNTISTNVENTLKKSIKNVQRLAGENRVETAEKIAFVRHEFTGKRAMGDSVATMNGYNFADALSAAPFLGILAKEEISNTYLYPKSMGHAFMVFGGTNSVPKASLEKYRFAGSNRYGTAVEVAKAYDKFRDEKIDTIVLVDGTNYPDALASAPVASINNGAILLTDSKILSKEIKNFIDSNENIENIIIVGGNNSVSSSIEKELKGSDIIKPTDPTEPVKPEEPTAPEGSIASMSKKEVMELYNNQKPIDTSNDQIYDLVGKGTESVYLPAENFKIIDDLTLIFKDNQGYMRKLINPGIEVIPGDYVSEIGAGNYKWYLYGAKSTMEWMLYKGKPQKIWLQGIVSVDDKEICAELASGSGSSVGYLYDILISYGFAKHDKSFTNFTATGFASAQQKYERLAEKEERAKSIKFGIWAD